MRAELWRGASLAATSSQAGRVCDLPRYLSPPKPHPLSCHSLPYVLGITHGLSSAIALEEASISGSE